MDSESEPGSELTTLQQDIKATSDDLAADAAAVKAIETEKAELPANHPRLAELAARREQITARMADKAKIEKELVDKAAAAVRDAGSAA